ncbi:Mobile element protein [Cupriavidus basilensis]|uniref:Mobile element protein n=1 Tax=Cupriavidus basilensis TaxID=68895 RepID=A0A0C4YNS3_9BURK|nr:Mobile element protein [Cupriavidus basilensis]
MQGRSRESVGFAEHCSIDLDAWLDQYNNRREYRGRWCYGKTPMRTFLDSLELAKEELIPH